MVVSEFIPTLPDEMHMLPGDLVGIEMVFEDGWCRSQNVSKQRARGYFPMAILNPIKSGPSQTVVNSQYLSRATAEEISQAIKSEPKKSVEIPVRSVSKQKNPKT